MKKTALNKLKKSLPKGYRAKLAEKYNCSISYIDNVLNGRTENIDVVQLGLDMIEEIKKESARIEAEINKLPAEPLPA